MIPIPVPDGVAEAMNGTRTVFTPPDGDMLSDEIRSCEGVISPLGICILVALDDEDREMAAAGRPLWVIFQSHRLPPFALQFDPGQETPA